VFDAMTPIVHITAANRVAGQHQKHGEALLATRENTNWAMNFVLGAILRFQTIPTPFDVWGRHAIKALAAGPVIDVNGAEVRRLRVGEVIQDAGFCLHMVGDAWVWEEAGQKRFAKVADCELVKSQRHAEISRERLREHFKAAQAAKPPNASPD
jgi:hypothetical protein